MGCTRLVITVAIAIFFVNTLTYFAYQHHGDGPSLDPALASARLRVSNAFPRKIWQTSKHPPMALEPEYRDNIKRWNEVNPRWRHEVLTDKGSDEYVRTRFGDQPDVVEVYTGLTDNIMRADMFRYLVLLGDGGLYCDIDTEVLKPIEQWVPQELKNRTSAVIGVEYDTFGQGRGQALLDLQFTNWTLMSKPGHRLMEIVVANVVKAIRALAEKQGVGVDRVKATFNDVLASTGPVQLTRSTWQYLSEVSGEEYTWQKVTGLRQPMLVHDVLILPVTAFGNGQTHSNAGPPTDPTALVHHQFKGTWKTGSHAFSEMKNSEEKNW